LNSALSKPFDNINSQHINKNEIRKVIIPRSLVENQNLPLFGISLAGKNHKRKDKKKIKKLLDWKIYKMCNDGHNYEELSSHHYKSHDEQKLG